MEAVSQTNKNGENIQYPFSISTPHTPPPHSSLAEKQYMAFLSHSYLLRPAVNLYSHEQNALQSFDMSA